MKKDPAVLLYIDKWLVATKSMPAEARGWYLNLILTQYDRGGMLPNELEELALICDVRFSEFEKFKQMWEQVLKQKFKQNEEGMLYNEMCLEILQSRETFKEKRTTAGSIGFVVKIAREAKYTEKMIENLKSWPEIETLFNKDKQVLKQELQHLHKLFINKDVNKDIDKDKEDKKVFFQVFWEKYDYDKGKASCLKYWMRMSMDNINKALDKVDDYVASTPNVQYRKSPYNWLQGQHYNDEIILPSQKQLPTKFEQAAKADLQSMIRYE